MGCNWLFSFCASKWAPLNVHQWLKMCTSHASNECQSPWFVQKNSTPLCEHLFGPCNFNSANKAPDENILECEETTWGDENYMRWISELPEIMSAGRNPGAGGCRTLVIHVYHHSYTSPISCTSGIIQRLPNSKLGVPISHTTLLRQTSMLIFCNTDHVSLSQVSQLTWCYHQK